MNNTKIVRATARRRCSAALQWLGLIVAALFMCCRVSGQSYYIDWYKVSGGGGASSGGSFTLAGTIGQHDAGGPSAGGGYSVTGGFWSMISLVQTPGAPTLYISRSGGPVTVYWQAVSGWALQQNASLKQSGSWTNSVGVTTSSGTNYLNVALPLGAQFFRLKGQ